MPPRSDALTAELLAALAPDRRQFAPALVEVAEGAPRALTALLPSVALVLTAVAVVWAALADIDIVATAPGQVMPPNKVQLVQPAAGGIVRAIAVRNGAAVQPGDEVMQLDDADVQAEKRKLENRQRELQVERTFLEAASAAPDRDPGEAAPPADGMAELVRLRGDAHRGEWRAYLAELGAIDADIARLKAAAAATSAERNRTAASVPYLRERVEAKRELTARGLLARLEQLTLEQELTEATMDVDVLDRRIAQAEADVGVAEARWRERVETRQKDIARRLADTRQELAVVADDLGKAVQAVERRSVRAPAAGIVTDLAVHTVGGVVREGDAVMKVVPADAELEVEANVANRDVALVRVGASVEVKVDSLPYTRHGTIKGEIVRLAAAAAGDDPKANGYRATIRLEQDHLYDKGQPVKLIPGMTVVADVKTGDRTVMEYLLAPVMRYKREALRER